MENASVWNVGSFLRIAKLVLSMLPLGSSIALPVLMDFTNPMMEQLVLTFVMRWFLTAPIAFLM